MYLSSPDLSAGRTRLLTVLVQKHPDGDAAHVEAVQEVLDVLADDGVRAVGLLVLHQPLGHGGNHVVVSVQDLDDGVGEAEGGRMGLESTAWGVRGVDWSLYSGFKS